MIDKSKSPNNDVDERAWLDNALHDGEELFRFLTAVAPVGIYLTDPQGDCLYANAHWCEMAGMKMQDAMGQGWVKGLHPEDRAYVFDNWQKMVASDGTWGLEYRFQRPDKKITWVYAFASSQRNEVGEIHRYVGVNLDITQLKITEESLRASEERYRTIFSSMSEGFCVVEMLFDERGHPADYRFLETNPVFESQTGLKDAKGKRMRELAPEHEEHWFEIYGKVAETGEPIQFENEAKALHRWFTVNAYRVGGKDSRKVGIIFDDITPRKQVEAEKEKVHAQLLQAQKMESVGRLAGGVAHDFNNMLGVILGYTEMALEKVDPSHSLYEDLLQIQIAGERSAELTRQMLAFARKQTAAPEVLDLNAAVSEALLLLRRVIGDSIEITWQPTRELCWVVMDPGQFTQLLTNLCLNARDAIADVGSITLSTNNCVVAADNNTDFDDAVPGEYAKLTITDSGYGMDKETAIHIFEPFFTTKNVGEGTGLGLSTVYGVIKQNHGFIRVFSELGKGTTFEIYLPKYKGAEKPRGEQTKKAAAPVKPKKATVLLVEDEVTVMLLTAKILQAQGYAVLQAERPAAAIRLAREHAGTIDLLLTDVVMPDMNGRDLARLLTLNYPQLTCLFMSGYTADVIAEQGILDLGVHFIHKPFSIQELAEKVRAVLDEKLNSK